MELFVKNLPSSCSKCGFYYVKPRNEKYSEYPACKLLGAMDMDECLGSDSEYSKKMVEGFVNCRCPLRKAK